MRARRLHIHPLRIAVDPAEPPNLPDESGITEHELLQMLITHLDGSQAHGVLYMIYLVTAFDLGWKMKWRIERILLVMLAGTLPFASFVAERKVARAVQESGRVGEPLQAA